MRIGRVVLEVDLLNIARVEKVTVAVHFLASLAMKPLDIALVFRLIMPFESRHLLALEHIKITPLKRASAPRASRSFGYRT